MKTLINKIESLIDNSQYNEATQTVKDAFKIDLFVMNKVNKQYFSDDKDFRDVYTLTLQKDNKEYTFEFEQSLQNSDHWEIRDSKDRNINMMFNYFVTEDRVKGEIKRIQKLDKLKAVFVKGKQPTLYDVLTCLQKYDVGTFENFCDDYGYDNDSRTAEKTYKAVVKEFQAMERLFNSEELEVLQMIQ